MLLNQPQQKLGQSCTNRQNLSLHTKHKKVVRKDVPQMGPHTKYFLMHFCAHCIAIVLIFC